MLSATIQLGSRPADGGRMEIGPATKTQADSASSRSWRTGRAEPAATGSDGGNSSVIPGRRCTSARSPDGAARFSFRTNVACFARSTGYKIPSYIGIIRDLVNLLSFSAFCTISEMVTYAFESL